VQPSDFSKDKEGQIIKAPQDYWAFDPTPLPPPLTPTWELAGEISAADRALSELAVVFAPHSVSLVLPGADGYKKVGGGEERALLAALALGHQHLLLIKEHIGQSNVDQLVGANPSVK